MEQTKCNICGQEMNEQTAFCPQCGAPKEILQEQTYEPQNQNYAPQSQNQPASGMAISSMVLGIVSLVLSCLAIGWITAIISLIQGILVLAGNKSGRGMAISGIVMSAVTLLYSLVLILLLMIGIESWL